MTQQLSIKEIQSLRIKAPSRSHYRLILLSILLGFALLQSRFITHAPLMYEEGLNLQVSHFISQGYKPYTQIFTLSNPLFVWFLGLLAKFDLPIKGFRPFFFLFSLLLILNVAVVARFWLGRKSALAAVFLLATAVTFLGEAAAITDIIPALSIGTLSLTFTTRYLITKRRYWLFLGGACWGIALFISIAVISLGLVTVLLIIFSQVDVQRNVSPVIDGKSIAKSAGTWLVGGLAALAIGLFLVASDINHLLLDLAKIGQNLPLKPQKALVPLGHFLAFNLWLSLLAVYSIAQLYNKKPNHVLWLALVWFLITFAWLMFGANLRPVDFGILLPALSILAGWGLADIGQRFLNYSRSRLPFRSGQLFWSIGLGFVIISLYSLINWQRFYEFTLHEVDTGDDMIQLQQRQDIADFINQYTDSDDCVLIDDPALAVVANRWPTPQLVGLSEERLRGGLLTDRQLAALITEGQCKAIVFSNREYYEYFSEFGSWLRQNYPNEAKYIRTRIHYK